MHFLRSHGRQYQRQPVKGKKKWHREGLEYSESASAHTHTHLAFLKIRISFWWAYHTVSLFHTPCKDSAGVNKLSHCSSWRSHALDWPRCGAGSVDCPIIHLLCAWLVPPLTSVRDWQTRFVTEVRPAHTNPLRRPGVMTRKNGT